MVKQNLQNLQNKILQISQKYQVKPPQIIAVSKNQPIEAILEAYHAGQRDFGENRVQELIQKVPLLPHDIRWHLIGNLQTNKVKYIASFVHLIHSVDSEKLLTEIQKQALKHHRLIPILIQINISDEPQKNGCSFNEALQLLENITKYPNIKIQGLMAIAENTDNKSVILNQFKHLKEFFESCKKKENEQIQMQELSIGMSGDYEEAIQVGSTMVRIGTAIFGERNIKL